MGKLRLDSRESALFSEFDANLSISALSPTDG